MARKQRQDDALAELLAAASPPGAAEAFEAMQVAEEGLRKGEGRMDELRQFLAKRAEDSGNRERYLDLQFAQATDRLTLDKYKAFKKMCMADEWAVFESKVLDRLTDTRETEQR